MFQSGPSDIFPLKWITRAVLRYILWAYPLTGAYKNKTDMMKEEIDLFPGTKERVLGMKFMILRKLRRKKYSFLQDYLSAKKSAGIANKRRLEELEGRQARGMPQKCWRLVPRLPQPTKITHVDLPLS